MEADVQQLYQSSICSVHNFLCRCQECTTSKKEYQAEFVIAYIRKGNFQFNVFRNEMDAYHGLFLINKPGYDYRVRHVHNLPDECTLFSIPAATLYSLREQARAFAWFFNDPDKQSVLVKATPATEYLHHCIFKLLQSRTFSRLWLETLISELFLQVLSSDQRSADIPCVTVNQKRHFMPVIEKIKLYMNENFREDISLAELAAMANMSVFHFNRLFKKITSYTPYKYLVHVRLQLAHLHLKHTSSQVTEIAFSSGFNSLEHFSARYKEFFGKAPSEDRF